MKKLSLIILSFAIIFTGFFVSACGSKSEGKITLSQENVVLYLGENEDNSVTINAKVEGIKVERLRLYYDNSNINIKSSSKKEDNSFDLTIKAITTLSVDPIQVRVEASKDVTAVFYVEVSLPLTSISVQENLYIPYSGNDVEFNLNDKLIFTPQGTKQTDVFYEFIDNQPEGVEIVDGILKIAAAEYIYSSAPIKIKVQSAEVGKSAIMNQFEVFVLQNVKAYANEIVFETNYNGSINEMNNSNFELKIEDKTLSVFDVFVKIPKDLGISVELDSKRTSYESGNILDIIDCSTLSYVEGEFSVHKFIFSTTKQLSGNGNLYFNFFYENYKSDERLNSSFVKVKNANNYDLIDCLGIDVVIPIKGIFVKTSCITNVNGNYVIYKNYNTTTMQYGTEFSFGADPVNTTQTQLSIIKLSANLDVYRVNGTKVLEGETILVNEKLYIKGNSSTPESAYLGNIFKVESGLINKEIKFDISSGATMFGFVSNAGDTNAKATTDIAVEQGDESNFYIYAPGASLSDIVYDSLVMEFLREGDWFVGLVKGVEIGKKAYAISTNNGFTITLNLTTIARINNVIIQLKEGTTAGVGKVSTEGYLSFALKYGYSVELEYMVGDNSEIAKINYYFYDTMIGETRDAYDEYAVSPEELIESDYELYSNVVNTQNLVQQNLVTGKTEGRTIIKVEVVGQKVENGVILEDVQEVQYILIEVYKPTTFIDANQKVITLRSQDQVDELYYDTTVYTIPLVAKSNATEDSTYYQLYLDGGLYQTKTEIVDGVEVTVRETIFEYSWKNNYWSNIKSWN